MTLVMALGFLVVLSMVATTMLSYTASSSRSAAMSSKRTVAGFLAEAGINRALSVLNLTTNNALNPNLLPATRSDYAEGYVIWGGTLDARSATWTITSTGYVKNPNVPSQQSFHLSTASVPVSPTLTQPLNNPAWNYVYATKAASSGCDETLQQSVTVASPFYVNGNLCLENTSTITGGPLVVKGWVQLSQAANSVGTSAAPINEAHIAGSCKYRNNAWHTPCSSADNVFARTIDSNPTMVVAPTVYWDAWYKNASPGPYYPCTTSSGSTPTFDNDQGTTPDTTRRNASVTTVWNLTPSTSYTCQTAGGELSWNATTKVLTVGGTIFIDGSAYIQNGSVNSYNGQATLYLSGTFLMKNSKLCAGLSADRSTCDFAAWNPNTELLCVVTNSSGGQVNTGAGTQLISATYQGALYATKNIDTDTTSAADGPMIGEQVNLGQSVTTSFPTITTVPVGMPSNPTVYAQPNRPQLNL
jgi:hypothetical protein